MTTTVTTTKTTTTAEQYYEAERLPASKTIDFRQQQYGQKTNNGDEDKNHHLPLDIVRHPESGKLLAFAIPSILDADECAEMVRLAEDDGFETPERRRTLRTAKRTVYYENAEWSEKIFDRIENDLRDRLFSSEESGAGDLFGLHTNWRVVRYDAGDSFPGHQDQMDSFHVKREDGTKDIAYSTHTLLINIAPSTGASDVEGGGATRFYPKAVVTNPDKEQPGAYEDSVDVYLPTGWGLVFQQKGLVHAGQPVTSGVKYVAQAGVLSVLPADAKVAPSLFRYGPGLFTHFLDSANDYIKKSPEQVKIA